MHNNEIQSIKFDLQRLENKLNDSRLNEEDINLIVEKVCDKLEEKIYKDVGKGVLALAWKGLIIIILLIAGYGVGGHIFK